MRSRCLVVVCSVALVVSACGREAPREAVVAPEATLEAREPSADPGSNSAPASARTTTAPRDDARTPEPSGRAEVDPTIAPAARPSPGPAASGGVSPTGTYAYQVKSDNGTERRTMDVADIGPRRQRQTDRYADGTVDGRDMGFRADGIYVEHARPPGFACDVVPDLRQIAFPLRTGSSWEGNSECSNLVADVQLSYEARVRGPGVITIGGEQVHVWIIYATLVTTVRSTNSGTYTSKRVDWFDPRLGFSVRTDYDNDGRLRSETLVSRDPT